jgi:hypothetical protein
MSGSARRPFRHRWKIFEKKKSQPGKFFFQPGRHPRSGPALTARHPAFPADDTPRPTRRCSALIPLHRRLPHLTDRLAQSPPLPCSCSAPCPRHRHRLSLSMRTARAQRLIAAALPTPSDTALSVPRLPTRPDPAVALTRRVCLRACGAALLLAGHDDVVVFSTPAPSTTR